MSNIRPSIYHALFLYTFITLISFSCKLDSKPEKRSSEASRITFNGKTMGTTYSIAYVDTTVVDHQSAIDSILVDINQAVSTYIPSSIISQINNDSLGTTATILQNGISTENKKYEFPINQHFTENYINSLNVYRKTAGYFDPTVMPLVNYWGFGYTIKKAVSKTDSIKVKKLMKSVGFDNWSDQIGFDAMQFIKPINAQLDFSAIAKGYAVDEISGYLESHSIQNYIVEIGGEVYCKGYKLNNKKWTIALSKPEINASVRDVEMAVELDDVGLASSGNYRNFYEVNGNIYGHELNPHTGYPEINDILGVSVISSNCMIADAYATAFMIMGREESEDLVEQLPDTEAIFFYASEDKKIIHTLSSGFHKYVKSN